MSTKMRRTGLRIFWIGGDHAGDHRSVFAGNFEAMQTMVVLAGLPFSVVLVLFMFGLHKAMRQDVQIEQEQAETGGSWSSWFQRAFDSVGPAASQSIVQRFHG